LSFDSAVTLQLVNLRDQLAGAGSYGWAARSVKLLEQTEKLIAQRIVVLACFGEYQPM
jgi:hypothetical protein